MILTGMPVPEPTIKSQPYFDALNDGRLAIPTCTACGAHHWAPVPLCPQCGGELSWQEVAPEGTIYSLTTVHQASNAALVDQVPYTIALVDVAPGVRLIFNLVAPPDIADLDLVDAPVVVRFGEMRPDGQRRVWVELRP